MPEKFYTLLALQFVAHLLSDFIFQSAIIAKEKNAKGIHSKYLYIHIFITFLFSFILSFQWNYVLGAIAISTLHFIIDALKAFLLKKNIITKLLFYLDQLLHLTIITGVVYYFSKYFDVVIDFNIDNKYIWIFLGFLFTAKPSNILIKEIFHSFSIPGIGINDLPNAGKLIGIIERWLILIFVLIGQFEAVGFLLASKSILRYGDKKSENPNKTEYVLIGTLLSFAIAIVVGLLITKITH